MRYRYTNSKAKNPIKARDGDWKNQKPSLALGKVLHA
jgi:hypothetical protein